MNIVILAAGSGTRMLSDQPKILHLLAGKPIIHYVIEGACKLQPTKLVIVTGKHSDAIRKVFEETRTVDGSIVIQENQLGTGHAVNQAISRLNLSLPTLILYGDVPIINIEILKELIEIDPRNLGILTSVLKNPTGYGRIIRDNTNQVCRIVEEKNANKTEKKICEINTGIMIVPTHQLINWLKKINDNNEQKEFLLTDIIPLALSDGVAIETKKVEETYQILGVNNRKQLALLERQLQHYNAQKFLENGVTLADPQRFDVRGTLECGKDVFVDINALFEGHVTLGDRVSVGANCILKNCKIGKDSVIEPFSLIDSSEIGEKAFIGPYARLRPGTKLGNNTKVGNFVEIKNAKLEKKTKVNHLSYIGDAFIGENVNIGAGTITCNYDGQKKHQTFIGDNVFVGSACQLIAPLEIGRNKIIAAGTTVWRNAPEDHKELILNSKEQKKRPYKK